MFHVDKHYHCDVNMPTTITLALAKLLCFISQSISGWHINNNAQLTSHRTSSQDLKSLGAIKSKNLVFNFKFT
jgi:hypothetical protein